MHEILRNGHQAVQSLGSFGKKVVLSGILPHGHIVFGVFLSAMRHITQLQESGQYECAVVIADVEQNMKIGSKNSHTIRQVIESAKDLIAAGIDPENSLIYPQSAVKEELKALCNIFSIIGNCTDYELLMACDIPGAYYCRTA